MGPFNPASPVECLYVHVPFCVQKCHYCAFYSEASSGPLMERYVASVIRELELVAGELRPRTVFFGGGTPSLLGLRHWRQIGAAFQRLGLLGAAEWTVEANPATLSLEKAQLLRQCGVNRVSLGVQSLDEALLERLGRVHSRDMVFRSYDLLRKAGFDNVNLDLMFAIPGQSIEVWRSTVREILALESEHLSCYEVSYEEDTPLYRQMGAGPDDAAEELACAMYEEFLDQAGAAGFRQYEVANLARAVPGELGEFPQRACAHNVNYWRGGDFHGLGPSATGCVGGVRTRNVAHTRKYCDALDRGERAIEWRETLAPQARAGEVAAFGLRTVAGWPFDDFRRVTGMDLREGWAAEMADLVARGWGRMDATRFQLTRPGLRFADAAAADFLRA